MKKWMFLTSMAIFALVVVAMAEPKDGTTDIKYRRSSLHTILIDSDKFPFKDTVINAFYNAPFPDKYNNHTIGEKSFNAQKYALNADEHTASLKNQSAFSKLTATDTLKKDLPLVIEKYLKQERIANKLVAKWFDRQPDGSFDMNLIGERGSYNASEMQANIAKGSARGISSLNDAGVELIGNTFVVVSKFNYVSNEIVAAGIRQAALYAAGQIPNSIGRMVANKAAEVIYNKTKEGYSVWTTSYLYKLVWNDSIEAVFYNNLWTDKANLDQSKITAFDNSNLFNLEFVGDEKATGLVLFSLKEKRTEEQIIVKATVRTVDAVYAKLQKKYDVFMPKLPLYSGDPITAKIGMKEGLEGGEKFEVLEQTLDEKTGLTKYESKGTIKVDKDFIWDNRFNEGDVQATATDEKAVIDRTTFKGSKNFYSGMLIKQVR